MRSTVSQTFRISCGNEKNFEIIDSHYLNSVVMRAQEIANVLGEITVVHYSSGRHYCYPL